MILPDSSLHDSTVFLTGGTGFVGSHLAERLLSVGCREVRCLVRTDEKWLSGLNVKVVRGTLADSAVLEAAMKDVTHVFHVAALTRARDWNDFYEANVLGTDRLIRLARKSSTLKRIVLTSSLAAIGEAPGAVANESTPFNPVSQYGRSKAEMEQVAAGHDFPITILRPPAVYGPRETDIFTFFKTLSSGLCPVVGSAKTTALSLVHVDDLVTGMIQAAFHPEAEGKTFFLGGEQDYSWGEIRDAAKTALNRNVLTLPIPPALVPAIGNVAETIGNIFGFYPPLNKEKAREIVRATLRCDSSLAQSTFGYAPEKDLGTGITETISWYRERKWL